MDRVKKENYPTTILINNLKEMSFKHRLAINHFLHSFVIREIPEDFSLPFASRIIENSLYQYQVGADMEASDPRFERITKERSNVITKGRFSNVIEFLNVTDNWLDLDQRIAVTLMLTRIKPSEKGAFKVIYPQSGLL